MVFGIGVDCQTIFSKAGSCAYALETGAPQVSSDGGELSINLCWGAGVFFGVMIAGGVTGAHLNPAVSVTMALRKELEWSMVLPYFFAQFLGAFVASAVMFLNYSPAMYHYARKCCDGTDSPFYDGCREDTAHAWTSFPQRYESVGYGFADQLIGTAILLGGISAIIDAKQRRPHPPAGPFTVAASVGALVVAIGMSMGYNAGYPINPARDFGPRVFCWMAGWGDYVFKAGDMWWWVPIVAPLLGGPLGSLTYWSFVEVWLPQDAP
uniref:Aquaporin n=1 Tax=Florenciella parvula TaxID=236787 RepID=A0A7S2FSP7_9STRA|mmetsp:Transcript_23173/g.48015  ORF Transcript_23173/g.48015 Transcript_23173/m.48015 type:complete len:266 (+) Transcript_23173:2-799(+)